MFPICAEDLRTDHVTEIKSKKELFVLKMFSLIKLSKDFSVLCSTITLFKHYLFIIPKMRASIISKQTQQYKQSRGIRCWLVYFRN